MMTVSKYFALSLLIFSASLLPTLYGNEKTSHFFHPYYVSTVDIQHNSAEQILEITCKIFTDDFEKVLSKKNNRLKKIDLVNVKDTAAMDTIISNYICKNLQVKIDESPVTMQFIGFEKEKESVYSYFEVKGVSKVKNIQITNSLLNDYKKDQVNLIHVTVNGKRQSTKLNHGNIVAKFSY